MNSFFDRFVRRRRGPRVAARWSVDIQLFGTQQYLGFYTSDISTRGVRLEGGTPELVQRLLSPDGRAHLRLRLPNRPAPLLVEAELKWGMGDPLRTGWRFTRIASAVAAALEEYIATHPADLVE